MKTKKFVVMGGGTAGWFTALFLKKILPNHNITLIESSSIGTIGVGEATTPHIVNLIKYLDINLNDLLKNTLGTIKNGISFENWNGDNKKYFHGFDENLTNFSLPPLFDSDCFNFYMKNLINSELDFKDYLYIHKLSYSNKVDLNNINYAIHFDANLLANFLKTIAIKRGIKHIDGVFKNVVTDNNNNITNIVLKDKKNIDLDFVFDCSGFARLIIQNHYNQKWISYQNHLPMKKTIIIPKEKEELFPYTKAIAMKNGWIFEIPLNHRIGRGYVFDSDYIDEEQALKEAEEFYNEKIKIKKVINFKSGRMDNLWVNNCIAIGLSASFVEPLESTSLYLTVQQLFLLKHFMNDLFTQDKLSINLYNEICKSNMDEVMCFIYLHYITKRKDSKFWKEFKHKNKVPKVFKNILKRLKNNNLQNYNFFSNKAQPLFSLSSYIQVANGLELFKNNNNNDIYKDIIPSSIEYKNIIEQNVIKADTISKIILELNNDKTNIRYK